ncbi:acVLRF1 family peptidyl-tRNA hydrolase [Amycolatopsis sp. NPDC023774]|uniref:acVLRF1 family peptidyl-tRNA hydrolase n=1 Tax=Amycolatopsis sp. NPDC023774 TaxID=3155015 RepID=UPI0033EEDA1E
MARGRRVAGGGTAVEIAPGRLAGWFTRFAERNDGVSTTELGEYEVRVFAGNGVTATATVPFGPLAVTGTHEGLAVDPLVDHALVPRLLALLLVRLGGHSLGLARGGIVLVSRTDRHLVPGRTAAGGWSQQRFARRRAGQARVALRAAAQDAVEVLVPRLSEVDAVVLGGDRLALAELRADHRLDPLFARAQARVLEIPEPRRSVLDDAAERAISVDVVLSEG